MRLSTEARKKGCQIINFVDIAGRTPGLVCIPTPFGLDPSEIVDGNTHSVFLAAEESDPQIDESLEERAKERKRKPAWYFQLRTKLLLWKFRP